LLNFKLIIDNIEENMSHLNPLDTVLETVSFPESRTWRTNFFQKVKDTYYTYAGNVHVTSGKNHVGIFDYLTLMIPYNVAAFAEWSKLTIQELIEGERPEGFIQVVGVSFVCMMAIPAALLERTFTAVRLISAAVFSLCVLPFTALAHLLSKIKGDSLKETVRKISVHPVTYDIQKLDIEAKKPQTLDNFLNRKKLNWEDIRLDCLGTYHKLKIELCTNKGSEAVGIVNLDFSKEEDKESIKAILQLNLGELTDKLEARATVLALSWFGRKDISKDEVIRSRRPSTFI
jgi:hypothetical protein